MGVARRLRQIWTALSGTDPPWTPLAAALGAAIGGFLLTGIGVLGGPRAELAAGAALTAILSVLMFLYIRRTSQELASGFDSAQNDLHTILDAIPAMIAYWDRDLINRFANLASELWFNAKPGSLHGQHLRQLLGAERFDQELRHVEAALRGEPQTFEQAMAQTDGAGFRHALTHYIPDIRDGAVRGFYALVYDVSELTNNRLELAAALRENEELLRTLDLHSKVSVTDDKGYITYVNENFCRILGYRHDEVLGRPHSIVNSGVHSHAFWTRMWDTLANGQPWRGEICNRAKDGTLHWVDSIIAPFIGKDGRVQKYVSIGTDISVAKETETKLRYNEAFLERTGTVAGVGGWEFDLRTRALTWSPQTYRIHEVDPGYVPSIDAIVPFYVGEAGPAIRNAISVCEANGTPWDLELAAVTAKGRAIWVRSVGELECENGKPVRLMGALQDITARKTTERNLQESSERFSIAADSAGIGVWELDATSGELTWDDWMHRIYGKEKTEQPKHYSSWLDALHPEDRDRFQIEAEAAFSGIQDFNSEFRIIRPDGDIRYVKVASRNVRGPEGGILRTTGVNSDVTDSRRSEMVARRETASLLRTILDAASAVSIIATDRNLNIKVFNAGAERMLGFSSADVVGVETLERIHDPADLQVRCHALRPALDRGVDTERFITDLAMLDRPLECVYVRKNGTRVAVSLFVTPMQSDEGEILGYVSVAHDITRQKETEAALLQAKAKAENANSAKSLFLANMSHEIRTPMHAVIGLSYLLRHTPLTTEQSVFLAKLETAGNSLLSIITNILDLSKIEAGELLVESSVFSLPLLLREVAAMMLVQAEAKAIRFSMDTPADLPNALIGDPTRLRQILVNLLSNAIRFTYEGGVQFSIKQCSNASAHVDISFVVADTGIGISKETQDHIFSPFAQADASITRRYGGTGLGLSIVKRLSELLGGTVHVQSELGVGSTFTVSLPFVPATLSDLSASQDSGFAHPPGVLLGVRALVVDDSDINLEVAKRILVLDGMQVCLETDGQKAVERLRAEPDGFDVVLMDLQMPILDGYEATKRIRGELGLLRLPIIAVTAGALTSERHRAEDAGMTDFICKPFDAQSLTRMLLKHVQPNSSRQATPSPSAVAPPLAGDERWPQIDGIDTVDARARWCGDAALFTAMLARLLEEFATVDLPENLNDQRAVGLHVRRMHKLRGGACMLGAKTVYGLSGQIETTCIIGDMEQAVALTVALKSEIQRLIDNAEPVLAAARLRVAASATGTLGDLAPHAIEELDSLLRKQSLSAVDRFKSIAPQLRELMGEGPYERMRLHVDNLQFEDASNDLQGSMQRANAPAKVSGGR